jgi:hypothetical protein
MTVTSRVTQIVMSYLYQHNLLVRTMNNRCSKRPLHVCNSSHENHYIEETLPSIHSSMQGDTELLLLRSKLEDDQGLERCQKRMRNNVIGEGEQSDINRSRDEAFSLFHQLTQRAPQFEDTDSTAIQQQQQQQQQQPAIQESSPPTWWRQQQRRVQRSTDHQTNFCRICQKPYVPNYHTDTNRTDPVLYTDQQQNHSHFTKGFTRNGDTICSRTLLSYFPLMLVKKEDDETKPPPGATTIVTEYHSGCSVELEDWNQCQYCDRMDFCSQCVVQTCTLCLYQFCSFCRTINMDGQVQCIDCCRIQRSSVTPTMSRSSPLPEQRQRVSVNSSAESTDEMQLD